MRARSAAPAAVLALTVACGVPVGVRRTDPQTVHRMLTRNVISASELSADTVNVLHQRDLVERFADEPEHAIAELQAFVVGGRSLPSDLYALAELCFLHAEHGGGREYFLAASVYASAFLFPTDRTNRPQRLDPRYRVAADIYNRGLVEGLGTGPKCDFVPEAGSFPMPFGTLDITFDESDLLIGQRRLVRFVPVGDLIVEGLPTRYRWPGIGAPLAARTEPADPAAGADDFLLPWARIPLTAVLQIDDAFGQITRGHVVGHLSLIPATGYKTIDIDGHPVPLEVETTSSLALMLAESPVWEQEIRGFLQHEVTLRTETPRLASLRPYQWGRVPIVFVHGTASSVGRWAQMINELLNDPRIGPRVSFWLFTYDTGNPILYSSMLLREALTAAVNRFDPDGTDPGLHRMIVIGHSQGGLLAKLTAVDSGDLFWRNTRAPHPFAETPMNDSTRDLLTRGLFLQPLPFVKRIIYVATPQRGSYVAGNWLVHQVARFIVFPSDLAHLTRDLLGRSDFQALAGSRLTTSVENMTPGSPFIRVFQSLPLAPGITAHSIVAVQGDGPVEDGDDGVVTYASAHVTDVESELVVRSGHSCQDNPHTIDEVRRIVLEHLDGS